MTFVVLLSAVVLLVGYRQSFVQGSVEKNAWLAMGSAALAGVAIVAPRPTRWINAPTLYLAVFSAFHLGLAPLLALGWPVPEFGNPFGVQWLLRLPVAESLYIVAVSVLCFAVGARIGAVMGRPANAKGAPTADEDRAMKERCARAAVALAALGVLGWFGFVAARGGLGLFVGTYANYREFTGSGMLPLLYLLITMAAGLTAASLPHRLTKPAVGLLAVFAIVAFPLGARGEVLFPLVAGIAVFSKRRIVKIRPVRWLAVAILLFGAVSAGRSVRSTGIGDLGGPAVDVNPLHGLAELGYSLRPVAEAVNWQSTIDEPARGRTYARPFQRALSRLVPAIEVGPAESDSLVTNVLVEKRVGPIGFSPAAEGVINFGLVGAAGYLMLVGGVLGFLDRRPGHLSNLVLLAVVLVPLLVQVRNSFVAVPFQLVVGLAVWAMIVGGRRRPYH